MALNFGYVLIAVPIMHCRLLKGEYGRWLWRDTAMPLVMALMMGLFWRVIFPATQSRFILLIVLCCAAMTTLAATAMLSSTIRNFLMLYALTKGRVARQSLV